MVSLAAMLHLEYSNDFPECDLALSCTTEFGLEEGPSGVEISSA